MNKHDVLSKYFGYETFRQGQQSLIDCLLNGGDALGIMPTGAGKSICYQVPALLFSGITLVVSPLISLMQDQVTALVQSGVPAAYINSSLTPTQIHTVIKNAASGKYKIIYIAPERLLTSFFAGFARTAEISMLTVDEAHCISQWGQDFRPGYLDIPTFISSLPKRPIVSAFTATATQKVREDIVALLDLNQPEILVTGFNRENLYFEVQQPKRKFDALVAFLKDYSESSGIIYCATRKNVEEVFEKLCDMGFYATRYHAGLSDAERFKNQKDFILDYIPIMVATNAFGMGIDKSNVSYVLHYNMPKDIESYYQEAGRAGRDGMRAKCVLLYSAQDVRTAKWLIEQSGENMDEEAFEEKKARDLERLKFMTYYCTTSECLREYILKYFGERPKTFCGDCGNCNAQFQVEDVTVEAQKILSCIHRLKGRFGISMTVDVLRGSKNSSILSRGFDKLSTYNISNSDAQHLRFIIKNLIKDGYIEQSEGEYPVISLASISREILTQGKKYEINMPKLKTTARLPRDTGTKNTELFALLRSLRAEIAKSRGVPAFVIFTDSTLTDMCSILPRTREEFRSVSGVGNAKLEQFGEDFLRTIDEYMESLSDRARSGMGNAEFSLEEMLSKIMLSKSPISLRILTNNINEVLIEYANKKISAKALAEWFVEQEILQTISRGKGRTSKVPTQMGLDMGIVVVKREHKNGSFEQNLYPRELQKFAIDHLCDMI